jgi:rubrerythrin
VDAQTHRNLLSALHGEAFAYARYRLMAARAREGGDVRLAQMFDGLAAVELDEHFAELASLADIVGADADNVLAAIQDENEEVEKTYPTFADEARKTGELAVAERFEEIRTDELEHLRTLETALERLELPV